MGESELPPNRPKFAMVYIPETQQVRQNTNELNRGIIIDARLHPNHTTNAVQSILMSTCQSEFPLSVTHMVGYQYLLLLPSGSDRKLFLQKFAQPLQELGYVTYPWSAAVNGYPTKLKYKVWIELKRMSPQTWCIEHLLAAISSFGIVLDHTPMCRVRSLETMMAVMAVEDLGLIPHGIIMWIRGISRDVEVVVHSWLEEPLVHHPPPDTTPNDEFFTQVQTNNTRIQTGYSTDRDSKGIVSIQLDTLLAIWKSLDIGEEKDLLEATLRSSAFFDEAMLVPALAPSASATPLADPKEIPLPDYIDKGKKVISAEMESSINFPTGHQVRTSGLLFTSTELGQGSGHAELNAAGNFRRLEGTGNGGNTFQTFDLNNPAPNTGPMQGPVQQTGRLIFQTGFGDNPTGFSNTTPISNSNFSSAQRDSISPQIHNPFSQAAPQTPPFQTQNHFTNYQGPQPNSTHVTNPLPLNQIIATLHPTQPDPLPLNPDPLGVYSNPIPISSSPLRADTANSLIDPGLRKLAGDDHSLQWEENRVPKGEPGEAMADIEVEQVISQQADNGNGAEIEPSDYSPAQENEFEAEPSE